MTRLDALFVLTNIYVLEQPKNLINVAIGTSEIWLSACVGRGKTNIAADRDTPLAWIAGEETDEVEVVVAHHGRIFYKYTVIYVFPESL